MILEKISKKIWEKNFNYLKKLKEKVNKIKNLMDKILINIYSLIMSNIINILENNTIRKLIYSQLLKNDKFIIFFNNFFFFLKNF